MGLEALGEEPGRVPEDQVLTNPSLLEPPVVSATAGALGPAFLRELLAGHDPAGPLLSQWGMAAASLAPRPPANRRARRDPRAISGHARAVLLPCQLLTPAAENSVFLARLQAAPFSMGRKVSRQPGHIAPQSRVLPSVVDGTRPLSQTEVSMRLLGMGLPRDKALSETSFRHRKCSGLGWDAVTVLGCRGHRYGATGAPARPCGGHGPAFHWVYRQEGWLWYGAGPLGGGALSWSGEGAVKPPLKWGDGSGLRPLCQSMGRCSHVLTQQALCGLCLALPAAPPVWSLVPRHRRGDRGW